MKPILNKHKYMRVITFYSDKTSKITYHKKDNFKPDYLVNPDHIFLSNGFTTIVTSDTAPETINPLDFKSRYPKKMFETAINTKIIKDTFSTMKKRGLDLVLIFSGATLLVVVIILYLMIKQMGII